MISPASFAHVILGAGELTRVLGDAFAFPYSTFSPVDYPATVIRSRGGRESLLALTVCPDPEG